MNHQPAHASLANEQTCRPVIRPAVPILTMIDDGSIDEGKQIRIRTDGFVIGRSSGDLKIPNHATMSNGVWVNTPATTLTSYCFFQCGEQRFKFVIP